MLTFEDCIELCDLTAEEIAAISAHEHIPLIAAAEMGNYLVNLPDGEMRIKSMIKADIAAARDQGRQEVEMALKLVLRNFVLTHSSCEERHTDLLHSLERRSP
jgi:hypothetical protein